MDYSSGGESMQPKKKVGFPLFVGKGCCGPDCDCHKSEKNTKDDNKKK